MPTTRPDIQKFWIDYLLEHNAYWFHDGHRNRPYAELSGGDLSNFFANCTKITEFAWICEMAVRDLLAIAPIEVRQQAKAVIGSAYGGIDISYEIGRQLHIRNWYTEKVGDTKDMSFKRFQFTSQASVAVMAEDVVTTLGTTERSIKAALEQGRSVGAHILPVVLCLVNRSGHEVINGYTIYSLIDEKRARMWKPGSNPFTHDGKEPVPPVRPKGNWQVLTKSYND